ncbi:MAG TPA: hypothetical protein VKU89_10675 [Solirubrobacteraceae bacterium]|nr:hypothetical protein [Solirubrobacteraceae bacterium]
MVGAEIVTPTTRIRDNTARMDFLSALAAVGFFALLLLALDAIERI